MSTRDLLANPPCLVFFFFFSSRRRHTRFDCDWSSDVCSSDLPKTSVLNQFQQSHDVRNLFVVDGSSHVSASCQNPTWTIMALAWRSCDHLAEEDRKSVV